MDNMPDMSDLNAQIVSLSAEIAEQRQRIQDLESALVTRIADVDDDRRLTTKRLQRIWQQQRAEIETRLTSQVAKLALFLVLITLVLSAALLFVHRHGEALHRDLLEEIARLETRATSALTPTPPPIEDAGTASAPADSETAAVPPVAPNEPATPERADRASRHEEATPTPSTAPMTPSSEQTDSASDATTPARHAPPAPLPSQLDSAAARAAEASPAPIPSPIQSALDSASTPVDTAHPPRLVAESRDALMPTEEMQDASAHTGEIQATPTPTDEIQPVPTSSADPTMAQRPATTQRARIADESVTISDRTYALQLFAFSSRAAMLRFVRRHSLPERVYFREERFQGSPWLVLIHSLHPSVQEAAAVRAGLPSELAELDTWIRNLPIDTTLGVVEIEQ
ncbi:MAG: hypothetical protein EOM91_00690 [Sphingobacteriia bacterium]|nr:hypothetical protein [Sphingobacteriia bacterium]NCC38272.1 hypothetical protein [Gammaproteobacteria bacterium]